MQDDPDDPFQLQRFVNAQEGTLEVALAELRAGKKESHWMWFVLPQLAALGHSPTAIFYGIRSAEEACAYLAHHLLGERLHVAVQTMNGWAGLRSPDEILGRIDAMKFRSSLTLFAAASSHPLFTQALDALFEAPDAETLRLLQQV